jgi:hypothetical protein
MNRPTQQFLGNFFNNGLLSLKFKIFCLSVPKVACTNMRWWFADLANVSAEVKKNNPKLESSSELMIHEFFSSISPESVNLDFYQVLPIISESNFFSFGLVRNPYSRIFSAWQSKILLQEPLQIILFKEKSFLNLPIENISDIKFAFESFLEEILLEKNISNYDPHWAPQSLLLRPDLIQYKIISKIEDTQDLELFLKNHLAASFVNPFLNKSYNKSIIPYSHKFISNRAAEIINLIYEEDFSLFGYSKDILSSDFEIDDKITSLLAQGIKLIRMRHSAMTSLRDRLHHSYFMSADLEKHNADLEKHNADLEKHNADLEKHNADLEKHNADLEKHNADLEKHNADLEKHNADLEKHNADLEKHISEIKNSMPYKLISSLTFFNKN